MKGRKPKPTRLKVIAGNPGRRPLNKDEPQPEKADTRVPLSLSPEAKKHWKVIAKQLSDIGILTVVDKHALCMYCEEYARWKNAIKQMNGVEALENDKGVLYKNPWATIADKAFEHMLRLMPEFGMTPSSRSKLKVNQGKDFDPMEEFLKKNT